MKNSTFVNVSLPVRVVTESRDRVSREGSTRVVWQWDLELFGKTVAVDFTGRSGFPTEEDAVNDAKEKLEDWARNEREFAENPTPNLLGPRTFLKGVI